MNDVKRRTMAMAACAALAAGSAVACAAPPADPATPAAGVVAEPVGGSTAPGAASLTAETGDAPMPTGASAAEPATASGPGSEAAPGGADATARPAGDPADLAGALGRFGDAERVAEARLAAACGKSTTCLAELDAVARYIRNDCPRDSTCPSTAAAFLDPPAAAAPGGLPATYPTVSDIRDLLWKAMYDEANAEGGRSGTPGAAGTPSAPEPAAPDAPPGAETPPPPTGDTPAAVASPPG